MLRSNLFTDLGSFSYSCSTGKFVSRKMVKYTFDILESLFYTRDTLSNFKFLKSKDFAAAFNRFNLFSYHEFRFGGGGGLQTRVLSLTAVPQGNSYQGNG